MGAAKFEITRKSLLKKQPKPIPKLYSLEPKDCYTIQQACAKFSGFGCAAIAY